MRKSTLITPFYISCVWVLMISYQLFTQTAVAALINYINVALPSLGAWLLSRIDMIVFIFAFAWVFVLASVVPTVILGKNRSVLIQFLVCLTLTFLAFIIQDGLITIFRGGTVNQILNCAVFFNNPILATIYLAIPYILMLSIDICSKKRDKEEGKDNQQIDDVNLPIIRYR